MESKYPEKCPECEAPTFLEPAGEYMMVKCTRTGCFWWDYYKQDGTPVSTEERMKIKQDWNG